MTVLGNLSFNFTTVRNPSYGATYDAIIRRYLDELGGDGPSLNATSPNFITWSSSYDDGGTQYVLPLKINAGAYGNLSALAVASEGFFGFIKEGSTIAADGAWTNSGTSFFGDKSREYWNTKPDIGFVTRINSDNSAGRIWIWKVTDPASGIVIGSVVRLGFSTSTSYSEGTFCDVILQITKSRVKIYGFKRGSAGSYPLTMQVDNTSYRVDLFPDNWLYTYPSDEAIINFNTPPTTPTTLNTSFTSGQTLNGLGDVNLSASGSTDIDPGQIPKYFFEFYNGSSWIEFARNVTSGKNIKHTLPNINIPFAQYRVRAYDGYDYSPYGGSNSFNVIKSSKAIPTGLSFDGTGTTVTVSNRILSTGGSGTIEFSFKTSLQATTVLFGIDGGSTQILSAYLNSGGKLNVYANGTGLVFGSDTLNDGKLHHIAITFSGSNVKVYIDGVYRSNISTTIPTTVGSFYLADMKLLKPAGSQPFNGVIGLPRFWTVQLTDSEVASYKGKILPDTQPGLFDYLTFNELTAMPKMKKQSYVVTTDGIVSWTNIFVALTELILPSSNSQSVEILNYIRDNVNKFRTDNGLNPVQWTDPIIVKGITPIKAVHWNEVEDGINEIYTNTGQSFITQEVKNQFDEDILPGNKKFQISNLNKRIDNIIKGLRNV